jgi:hypothetical protein
MKQYYCFCQGGYSRYFMIVAVVLLIIILLSGKPHLLRL